MISIILSAPQMGENIGAVARAMKNFSLADLKIINPRDGWPNQKAEQTAVGAVDIIHNAKIYDNIVESVSGVSRIYALTARQRDINKPHIYLHELEDIPNDSAFLFGRESSGLTNEELSIADYVVLINTNPTYSSLNIAQAAILVCNQIFQSQKHDIANRLFDKNISTNQNLCDKAQLSYFLDYLVDILDQKGFFKVAEKRDNMICNIKNIFTRNNLSENELQTLMGIVKKIKQ